MSRSHEIIKTLIRVHDHHKTGLYLVLSPSGEPVEESLATTGYSARSNAVRHLNKRWSVCKEEGYVLVELAPCAVLEEQPQVEAEEEIEDEEFLDAVNAILALHVHWELFATYPESVAAANELTAALKDELLKAVKDKDQTLERAIRIRDGMYALMNKYSRLGARDTEPEVALVEALDEFFPDHAPISR